MRRHCRLEHFTQRVACSSGPPSQKLTPAKCPRAVVLRLSRWTLGCHGDCVEGSPRLRWLLAAGKGSASRCATLACPCAAALHLGVPRLHHHGSTPRSRLRTAVAHHPPLRTRHQQRRPQSLCHRAPGPAWQARAQAGVHPRRASIRLCPQAAGQARLHGVGLLSLGLRPRPVAGVG